MNTPQVADANGTPPQSTALVRAPVSEATEVWQLRNREAKAYSASTLLPLPYQGEKGIPNVLIAMEVAERIGCSIFMVAQNLDIIHNRPGWRSTFLIATVNASKRFTPLRFRFEGTQGKDDWGCRAVAKDLSDGEPCVGALITIGLAKAEGWYGRSGSKWQTIPEQMLMYRAAAFWTRIYCPELSLGIRTTEEAEDMVMDAPAYSVVDQGAPQPVDGSQVYDSYVKSLEVFRTEGGEVAFDALLARIKEDGEAGLMLLEQKVKLRDLAKTIKAEVKKRSKPAAAPTQKPADPNEPPFGSPAQATTAEAQRAARKAREVGEAPKAPPAVQTVASDPVPPPEPTKTGKTEEENELVAQELWNAIAKADETTLEDLKLRIDIAEAGGMKAKRVSLLRDELEKRERALVGIPG